MEINIEDIRLQECIERLETYKETRNVSQSTLATLSNSMRQYFKYCAMM